MLYAVGLCFVIQPFDGGGRFDKRYEDTFAPAIKSAGLEPYRVDRDPGAEVPIDYIHAKIKEATACLAEISTDNPNVWYELGYAIAANRPVVMVCTVGRPKFPFDIQHRSIITYSDESKRDWEKLGSEITERLTAAVLKAEDLSSLAAASSIADVEGLSHHELVTLVTIAENTMDIGDVVTAWQVKNDMERAGFTKIAVRLGTDVLLRKKLIAPEEFVDRDGDKITGLRVTPAGLEWLQRNQDKLLLMRAKAPKDDDIPF